TRGRINACGDPFTNATFYFDTNGIISGPFEWSGGGARVNGNCVSPVVLPNPAQGPGDRHPFYGTAVADELGGAFMGEGVEDAGKCDGTIPGVCVYNDFWFYNFVSQTWTQLASPPFKNGVYNWNLEYVTDAHK